MKLELKHLTGYLPYGLKTKLNTSKIITVAGLRSNSKKEICFISDGEYWSDVFKPKPLLHPLSYLTKEIEVNGEKFVPIEVLTKMYDLNINDFELRFENLLFVLYNRKGEFYQINDNNFYLFQKLYEWHFDIHELIDKGLAIDINTLN